MRIEVTIPDSTRPELKDRISAILDRLTREPEFADTIALEGDDDMDWLFTPEVLADLDRAAAEARLGLNLTLDKVDQHFAAKREEWQRKHRA